MKQLLELKIWTKGKEHNSFVKPDAWTKIRTGKKNTNKQKNTHKKTHKQTHRWTEGTASYDVLLYIVILVFCCSCIEFLLDSFPKRATYASCNMVLPNSITHGMNGFEVLGHGKWVMGFWSHALMYCISSAVIHNRKSRDSAAVIIKGLSL